MANKTAPWTPEQVAALERRQADTSRHAYTCANDECQSVLKPTTDGWVCETEGCGYKQDWAHDSDFRYTPKKGASRPATGKDIVEQIRANDHAFYVMMLARVKITDKKEELIVHAGYHRDTFLCHAEDQARKAILEQLVQRHSKPSIPRIVFNHSHQEQKHSLFDGAFDPTLTSLEFHVLESRPVLPEELEELHKLMPFAENNVNEKTET